MVERAPSGEDESGLEYDFEWVNAWAEAAGSAPAPAHVLTPPVTPGRPTKPAAAKNDDSLPPPAAAPADTPLFEGRRAQRWTNLFRIVTRESEADADPAPRRPPDDALASQPQRAPQEAFAHGQLARDISEIEVVRDQLLNEATPSEPPDMLAGRFAAVQTSDYIPILVGGVLAFTSLVVFGAAASLVSLR